MSILHISIRPAGLIIMTLSFLNHLWIPFFPVTIFFFFIPSIFACTVLETYAFFSVSFFHSQLNSPLFLFPCACGLFLLKIYESCCWIVFFTYFHRGWFRKLVSNVTPSFRWTFVVVLSLKELSPRHELFIIIIILFLAHPHLDLYSIEPVFW